MRKYALIALAFLVSLILWIIYVNTRLPPEIEAKGPDDWIPWISLAGSVISLLTGVVGLLLKFKQLTGNKGH